LLVAVVVVGLVLMVLVLLALALMVAVMVVEELTTVTEHHQLTQQLTALAVVAVEKVSLLVVEALLITMLALVVQVVMELLL
jgi:hypothetical protein